MDLNAAASISHLPKQDAVITARHSLGCAISRHLALAFWPPAGEQRPGRSCRAVRAAPLSPHLWARCPRCRPWRGRGEEAPAPTARPQRIGAALLRCQAGNDPLRLLSSSNTPKNRARLGCVAAEQAGCFSGARAAAVGAEHGAVLAAVLGFLLVAELGWSSSADLGVKSVGQVAIAVWAHGACVRGHAALRGCPR